MGTNRKQPFGYKMEQGRVVINAVEERWILHLYQKYSLGETIRELTAMMNGTGVYYDIDKPWNKNMVARILGDVRYTGEQGWPQIIKPELFGIVAEKKSMAEWNEDDIRQLVHTVKVISEDRMLMAQQLPQMELYCGIGKAVCRRTEKGAAVMASEYLNKQFPDVKGFSPRSLRRMRDFYRTYENHPPLLSRAMQLGWIQNVVIMEAELTMELREWYMKAVEQFGWSKTELTANIAANAHENIVLFIAEEYTVTKKEKYTANRYGSTIIMGVGIRGCSFSLDCQRRYKKKGQRGYTMSFSIFKKNQIYSLRC